MNASKGSSPNSILHNVNQEDIELRDEQLVQITAGSNGINSFSWTAMDEEKSGGAGSNGVMFESLGNFIHPNLAAKRR